MKLTLTLPSRVEAGVGVRSYMHFLIFEGGLCPPLFEILKMFIDSEYKVMGGHLFV